MPTQPINPPAAVEDEETKQAIVALVNADQDATAALPGGLRTGAIVSGVIVGSNAATTSPYARMECEQGPKANEYLAPVVPGSGYHDFRKVTIDVYGQKPAILAAMGQLRRLLDWQPKGNKPMALQTGALKHVMPLPGSGRMEEQKERVGGNTIWKGTLIYQVWTVRIVP